MRYLNPFWKLMRFLNIGMEAALRDNIKVVDDLIYKVIHSRIAKMSNQQLARSSKRSKSRILMSRILECKICINKWSYRPPKHIYRDYFVMRLGGTGKKFASPPTNSRTSTDYKSKALTTTPRYRVMGDLVDVIVSDEVAVDLECESNISLSCMKGFHPLIPVIQCTGLIDGGGCSGGPVFNTQGEVVGIFVMTYRGYAFAIHVSMLRKFLNEALKSIGEPPNNDEKDLKRKHLSDPSDEEIEDVPIE